MMISQIMLNLQRSFNSVKTTDEIKQYLLSKDRCEVTIYEKGILIGVGFLLKGIDELLGKYFNPPPPSGSK